MHNFQEKWWTGHVRRNTEEQFRDFFKNMTSWHQHLNHFELFHLQWWRIGGQQLSNPEKQHQAAKLSFFDQCVGFWSEMRQTSLRRTYNTIVFHLNLKKKGWGKLFTFFWIISITIFIFFSKMKPTTLQSSVQGTQSLSNKIPYQSEWRTFG